MKKLRSYLAAASMRLGLPMDIAAGLPHLEVNGFRECSVDRHTGILEYNRERIVIGLNIGQSQQSGKTIIRIKTLPLQR